MSTPPNPPRSTITVIKRAAQRGEAIELTELRDAFEALRDTTTQPSRLFALAIEELQTLDSIGARSCDARLLGEALLTASLRVLEGGDDGVDAIAVAFATERLEKHLRSAGRAMDAASQVRAMGALVNGYVLAGDLEAAGAAAARWIKRAEKYAAELADGRREHLRALSRAVEIAATQGDDKTALRWAGARVTALRESPAAHDGAALADALSTVATLLASAGDLPRTRIAAREWLAAERELAAVRDESMRADRRVAALGLVAMTAGASGAMDEWSSAVEERVRLARSEFEQAGGGELRNFAAGVLAESLRERVDLLMSRGEWDLAIATAREWLDLESQASGDSLVGIASALALNASLAAQTSDWERCIAVTDRLLDLPPVAALRASRSKPVRKTADKIRRISRKTASSESADDRWASLCDAALSFAARANYARSEYASAARFARERLSDLAASMVSASAEEDPPATTLLVLAQSEEALVRAGGRDGVALGWKAFHTQARTMLDAIDALPRGRIDAATRCAALAWLALADALSGSDTAALGHADDAQRKLGSLASVPRELVSYVSFVHQFTRPARARTPSAAAKALDPLVASARALAAAVAGDAATAGHYLATIDLDTLASQPDALAHTLAAGARVLARLPPDERASADQAAREVAGFATLLAARAEL